MDINQLTEILKKKILDNGNIKNVEIEYKTYLHLKHKSHEKNKYHVKLTIFSDELKLISKLDATKKINKILQDEIKNYIHSIQILIE